MIFAKENFNINNFNEELINAVGNRLENENYEDAVKQALLFITDIFRSKTGLTEDGVSLVSKALSPSNPLIQINELKDDTDENEQKGIMFLSQGIYAAFRNPLNHTIHTKITEKECMRQLIIIDMVYDYITRDLKIENAISQALFDLVNKSNKDYYYERENDKQIKKNLMLDNIWIHGVSGVGKTNAAIYYTLNNPCKFIHTIYFSDLEDYGIDTIIQNIFESLYDAVLVTELTISPSVDQNKSNDKKELLKLICLLVNKFSNIVLIFDDIPQLDSNEFNDFFKFLLVLFKNSSSGIGCNSNKLKLLITSIVNPLENFALLDAVKKEKIEENLKFIKFDYWNDKEIINLKKLIEKQTGSQVSDEKAISLAEGKPRKLKRLIKDSISGDIK